jgi:hypothetical protein
MSSVTLRVRSKFVTSQLYQFNPKLWEHLQKMYTLNKTEKIKKDSKDQK